MIRRLMSAARDVLDAALVSPGATWTGVPIQGLTRDQLIRDLERERQHSLDLEGELASQEERCETEKDQLRTEVQDLASRLQQATEAYETIQVRLADAMKANGAASLEVAGLNGKLSRKTAQLQELLAKVEPVLAKVDGPAAEVLARTVSILRASP